MELRFSPFRLPKQRPKPQMGENPLRSALLFLGVFAGLFCLLKNTSLTVSAVRESLARLLTSVLPSTFPYMVLSGVLSGILCETSGLFQKKNGRLSRFFRRLFALPLSALPVFLLGLISGFPVGAATTASLYRKGDLTKDEAERLLAVSNFCGPPFLISVIGRQLLHSETAGWLLYAVQSFVSLGFAMLLAHRAKKESPLSSAPSSSSSSADSSSFSLLLFRSLKNAGESMLVITACLLFFGIFARLLSDLFQSLGLPLLLEGILCGFLEISVGIARAAQITAALFPENTTAALFALSLVSVWSGFSVHMQVSSFVLPLRLQMRTYYIVRLISTGLIAALTVLLYFLPSVC